MSFKKKSSSNESLDSSIKQLTHIRWNNTDYSIAIDMLESIIVNVKIIYIVISVLIFS